MVKTSGILESVWIHVGRRHKGLHSHEPQCKPLLNVAPWVPSWLTLAQP